MTDFSKKEKSEWSEVHSDVVRYEGFEPPTFWFVVIIKAFFIVL